jgi:hypothetical protein
MREVVEQEALRLPPPLLEDLEAAEEAALAAMVMP